VADVIEVIPEGWWQIVLVGMALPDDHPAIQVQRHRKDEPDNWRGQRVGKGKMPAAAFDNAIRAGQREREEARPHREHRESDRNYADRCLQHTRFREEQLTGWMASFCVAPYIVRPHLHNWQMDWPLIRDLLRLGVEPECWAWDEDSIDRVPTPGRLREAA
jgi:hypothetical protein